MKENFIDKVVGFISPSMGLSRLQNRAMIQAYNNAYDGANKSTGLRKSSSHWKSINGHEELNLNRYDREVLTLEGYNALRNDPIVNACISRLQDMISENGIGIQAKTTDDDFNEQAELVFKNWSKICDYRQRLNLADFQRLIISELFISGEIFFVLMANHQIVAIEANRIQTPLELASNPAIIQGIKVTKAGIPLGIYICNRSDNGRTDLKDYQFVAIENVIHIKNVIRPDQIRGTPLLAPILTMLTDRNELKNNLLIKSKIDSTQQMILTSNKIITPANSGLNRNTIADTASDEMYFEKTDTGAFYKLKPGDDLKPYRSETPNNTYEAFNKLLMKEIGACVGLPYSVLALDFSGGNNRTDLVMASKTIKRYQAIITEKFLSRLWNWRVAVAINDGEIKQAPKDRILGFSEWHKVTYLVPGLDWIDGNESANNLIDYKMNITSLSDICKKRGVEFEDVIDEKIYERVFAKKKLDEAKKEYGLDTSLTELFDSANDPGQFNNNQIDRGNEEPKGNN